MTKDCSGGQTFTSKGLEAPAGNACIGLVRDTMGCPIAWKPAPCPDMKGYLEGQRGTPNHRLLLRVWRYGWSFYTDNKAEQAESRKWLAEHFTRQFTVEGQYWGETLTTSHYQLWALGVLAARYLAHQHDLDPQVENLTGQWWRREMYLYTRLDREGYVFSPGSRSSVNHVDLRTVIYSMLSGNPVPPRLKDPSRPMAGKPNDENGPFWRDVYNSPAWLLRVMLNSNDDIGGAASGHTETALLRDPLYLYSRGKDFKFEFPRFTHASDALWWTARINGKYSDSPWQRSEIRNMDNPFHSPDLPGSTLEIVPGVHGKTPEVLHGNSEEDGSEEGDQDN